MTTYYDMGRPNPNSPRYAAIQQLVFEQAIRDHHERTLTALCGPMGRILPPDPPKPWSFLRAS